MVLFDGVCNFCDATVQFIIARDEQSHFRFAPLQGKTAETVFAGAGWTGERPDSIILVQGGQLYTHSSAALRILGSLGWPWRLVAAARCIPVSIRDGIYKYIARNRYRWFGKRDVCRVPDADVRSRFLD